MGVFLGLWSYNAHYIAEEVAKFPELRQKTTIVTFDLDELAVDVAGPDATLTGPGYELSDGQRLFLFGRAETIYGGSVEIQRNIIAERGLGLPRE